MDYLAEDLIILWCCFWFRKCMITFELVTSQTFCIVCFKITIIEPYHTLVLPNNILKFISKITSFLSFSLPLPFHKQSSNNQAHRTQIPKNMHRRISQAHNRQNRRNNQICHSLHILYIYLNIKINFMMSISPSIFFFPLCYLLTVYICYHCQKSKRKYRNHHHMPLMSTMDKNC